VVEPGRFIEIGRCERGDGVAFFLEGRSHELTGWDHFRRA
jgi:thiamine monophosphate kinase